MEAISSKQERVTRITRMVSQLSAEEQTELLKRLEQKIMIEKAQKLAEGVTKNSLSMAEIVNEVRKVRQNK
jgi:hypothetical protein